MYRSPKCLGKERGEVDLSADDWSIDGVKVLTSRAERYIGIGSMSDRSVLLLTRSIHTFGMKKTISIVVLDVSGTVVQTGVVHPSRIVWFPGLRWVIETGTGATLPPPGTEIVASTIRENAWHTDPLRNTDWESWRSLRTRR
jgi:hypothetical protein